MIYLGGLGSDQLGYYIKALDKLKVLAVGLFKMIQSGLGMNQKRMINRNKNQACI